MARTNGLAVAAVVIWGPGAGAQRQALQEAAGCDVVDLDDPSAPEDAAASWPLAAWAAARPVGVAGGPALEPYAAWEERWVPDPRDAGRHAIDPVLLEIVEAEGPVLASYAYRAYVRASGGRAVTGVARAPLSASVHRLLQAGRLERSEDAEQGEEVLRAAGSEAVRVRELGPRALDEVPLAEVAALMGRLRADGVGDDDLPRAVLDAYGLVRMTARAEASLAAALRRLG